MSEVHFGQGIAPRAAAASKAALKIFLGTAASMILATTGWSYGGAANYSSTVRPAGPRTGTSGTNFFNIEGDGNGANASFGVLEFNASSFNIGAGVTDVSNLTLFLTESNSSFTAPGTLNFYLSEDTTTDIRPANTGLTYQAGSAPEGVGSQLAPLTLLGTGAFSTTGNTNAGKVDSYTLSLPSSVQSYFLSQINAGGLLRFVVTPTLSSTAATFAGSTNATVSSRPTLSFDASLNQPSLGWKGGDGAWNPAGTAGDTSWSGGPWQSDHTAIFNTAGGGNVALSGAVTAVGMTFDADGYTINGAAGTSLTLTGGLVQVTNAGQTATVGAVLAGTAGITKNGAGTLVLAGQNTYSGATTINGGTLSVSSDANLGAAANGVALNGGTLCTGAAVSLGAGRTLSGSGSLDATGGALTVNGVVAAGALSVKNGSVTFANAGGATFSSADVAGGSTLVLSGGVASSAARTIFSGDGAVLLTGDNSAFAGGFSTSRGTGAVGPTLTLSSDSSLGTGQLNFNAGVIQAANETNVTAAVSLGGNATIGGTTPGTTGAMNLSSFGLFGSSKKTLTVNVTTTLSGPVTGGTGTGVGNSLNKAGPGRLILLAFNSSYNGGTSVTGGTLEVGPQGVLGTGDISVTALANAHVTLRLDNSINSVDDLSNVVLTSNGEFHGQLDLNYASTDAPEVINSLAIDGVAVAPNTYTAAQLEALYPNIILGTGGLTINNLATVPEPSAVFTLTVVATAAAAFARGRKMAA